MKNYFALIFALCFYYGTIAQTANPETSESAILEKLHWIIERSDMDRSEERRVGKESRSRWEPVD